MHSPLLTDSLVKPWLQKMHQQSPACHSAAQGAQKGIQGVIRTPDRLSTLLGDCLIRDRHRWRGFAKYNAKEAKIRFFKGGDGEVLYEDGLLEA